MNFRSIAHLADQLLHWTRRLPTDIDVVVGVPRSGLLAANMLGLYLNVPVTDVEGFLAGKVWAQGRRGQKRLAEAGRCEEALLSRPCKVLVLDDSLRTGRAMQAVREQIGGDGGGHEVLYGAVYVHPDFVDAVDVYCEVLRDPRVFEWNVMHHFLLSECCLDMDGVLCWDPPESVNDDGSAYREFLQRATPYLIPTAEVGWIVTSRLEKYRAETEAWLEAHGVGYRHLVMLDHPSGALRRRLGIHAAFKAEVYRATGAELFIESSIKQSVEIARLAHRDVLCIDTMQLVHPGATPVPRRFTLPDLHETPPETVWRRVGRMAVVRPIRALKKRIV